MKKRPGDSPGGPRPRRTRASTAADTTRLLHELEVHQIELQLQNEELRAARRDLEVALEQYTELFDFAPTGYATIDPGGMIVEINHAGAALLGRPREALRGLRFVALITPEDQPTFRSLMLKARSGVGRGTAELTLSLAGRRAVISAKATLLPRTEPTVLVAFEDVTEVRDQQQRLSQVQQALEQADRHKDEFLATLSHELRNPLAPVRNSLYVLAHAPAGGDQSEKARAVIERQVEHLSRLIDDLLDVTRIARGKVHLRREGVDFGALVKRVVDDHRPSFDRAGLQLGLRVAEGSYWVDADAGRLVQVVSNLLGNALKFTPKGGHVLVSLELSRSQVRLSVKDDGVGVAPEMLPLLFDAFTQSPQTIERSHGGLGLGLSMVKGFVELHGGDVHAFSGGPGQGSEFVLVLPGRPPPVQTAIEASPSAHLPTRRVLLIEDNVDACESMRDALEIAGHQVQIAFDGPSGIVMARSFQPEAVLCDIGLPGMNGYQVATAMRNDPALRGTFLIALSGYGRPQDVVKAADSGFDRHLTKPPQLEVVEQLLAQAPVKPRAEAPPESALH